MKYGIVHFENDHRVQIWYDEMQAERAIHELLPGQHKVCRSGGPALIHYIGQQLVIGYYKPDPTFPNTLTALHRVEGPAKIIIEPGGTIFTYFYLRGKYLEEEDWAASETRKEHLSQYSTEEQVYIKLYGNYDMELSIKKAKAELGIED